MPDVKHQMGAFDTVCPIFILAFIGKCLVVEEEGAEIVAFVKGERPKPWIEIGRQARQERRLASWVAHELAGHGFVVFSTCNGQSNLLLAASGVNGSSGLRQATP